MDKVQEIFRKIYSLSENNKLNWEIDNPEKTRLVTMVGDFKITLYFNSMTHAFLVDDKTGNKIAEVHRAIVPRSENTDLPIHTLYDIAKRSALKIDKSLDDLISNLSNI